MGNFLNNSKVLFSFMVLFLGTFFVEASSYAKVSCGDVSFPAILPGILSSVVTLFQILVPILVVVMGLIDFTKTTTAKNMDNYNKNFVIFIKRVIMGVLIFLVIAIVKFGIGLVDNTAVSCMNCLINNAC